MALALEALAEGHAFGRTMEPVAVVLEQAATMSQLLRRAEAEGGAVSQRGAVGAAASGGASLS